MTVFYRYPDAKQAANGNFTPFMEALLKCSFLIIVLSVIDLTSYYSLFDVPVINYLEMGEISTLFLNQLPNYLLLLIPLLLTFRFRSLLWIQLSVLLLITYWITTDNIVQSKTQFILVSFTIYSPGLIYCARHFDRVAFIRNPERRWKLFAYIFITTMAITGINSWLNAIRVRNICLYTGTRMMLEGANNVVADSSFYYIGRCKNFIFWYNAARSSHVVYPAAKLQEMEVKVINIDSLNEKRDRYCDSLLKSENPYGG